MAESSGTEGGKDDHCRPKRHRGNTKHGSLKLEIPSCMRNDKKPDQGHHVASGGSDIPATEPPADFLPSIGDQKIVPIANSLLERATLILNKKKLLGETKASSTQGCNRGVPTAILNNMPLGTMSTDSGTSFSNNHENGSTVASGSVSENHPASIEDAFDKMTIEDPDKKEDPNKKMAPILALQKASTILPTLQNDCDTDTLLASGLAFEAMSRAAGLSREMMLAHIASTVADGNVSQEGSTDLTLSLSTAINLIRNASTIFKHEGREPGLQESELYQDMTSQLDNVEATARLLRDDNIGDLALSSNVADSERAELESISAALYGLSEDNEGSTTEGYRLAADPEPRVLNEAKSDPPGMTISRTDKNQPQFPSDYELGELAKKGSPSDLMKLSRNAMVSAILFMRQAHDQRFKTLFDPYLLNLSNPSENSPSNFSNNVRCFRAKELGGGSFGTVFMVPLLLSGKQCKKIAIKRSDLFAQNEEDYRKEVAKATTEAIILTRVGLNNQHKNVIRYFVSFSRRMRLPFPKDAAIPPGVKIPSMFSGENYRGYCFHLTECCEGGNLQRYLDITEATLATILTLFQGVIEGMIFIHSLGIMHRDLKPENVVLESEGHATIPKICDFGSGRMLDEGKDTIKTNETVGTVPYFSPEQRSASVDNEQTYGLSTDTYSLGIMFAQLVIQTGANYHHFCKKVLGRLSDAKDVNSSYFDELPQSTRLYRLFCTMTAENPAHRSPLTDVLSEVQSILGSLVEEEKE